MESPPPPVPIEQLLAHRDWVRRVARALARDESAADDLEQDAWVEALERPPRSPRSIGGWFTAVLRHNLVDRKRADAARHRRQEASARPEGVPSTEEMVARADAHKRVVVAVMDLPEPYRATVLYRFFEELGPAEVSARTGVPTETVRTRTRRALAMLQTRLGGGEGGDSKSRVLALALLLQPRSPVLGGILVSKKAIASCVAVLLLFGWMGGRLLQEDGNPPAGASRPDAAVPSRTVAVKSGTAAPRAETPDAPSPLPPLPTRTLPVTVRDEAGATVPGVTVRCLAGPGEAVAADALGKLSILVPAGAPCRLLARAEGFADTEARVLPEYPSVLILLLGRRFLAGRVVDGATGAPVAGAPVHIVAGEVWKEDVRVWDAVTVANGEFRREGLPPGTFMVRAGWRPDDQGGTYDEAQAGPVAADTGDLHFGLSQGPVLAGIVLDEAGNPFRGPFSLQARTVEADRTDSDRLFTMGYVDDGTAGRFRLIRLEPGRYDLTVSPLQMDDQPQPYAAAVLRRAATGREDLELRLVRGLPIEGRVVDGEGLALAGTAIRLYGPEGEYPLSWGATQDANGGFSTGPLDPRQDYDLHLVHTDLKNGRQYYGLVRGVKPGTRDLRVVLRPSLRIEGVLHDEAGASPGAGVAVTAQCLDYRGIPIGFTVTGYTVADGTFSIVGIGAPGDLRFRLCAGGFRSRFVPQVSEGPYRVGDKGIALRLSSRGERVEGVVRLPRGAPGSPLLVAARPAGSRPGDLEEPWSVEVFTDAAGRFRFETLPRARVTLWVHWEGKTWNCGTVDAPSTGVELPVPAR